VQHVEEFLATHRHALDTVTLKHDLLHLVQLGEAMFEDKTP
jgi:hypothetical protein